MFHGFTFTTCASTVLSLAFLAPSISFIFLDDCPGRDVTSIRQQAEHFELSAILYYVSWCSDSRAARIVFDELAVYYLDHVYFAAVNCWHLECDCINTNRTNKYGSAAVAKKWPTTLVLRYGEQVSVKYKGEWNFAALSRFLNNVFQPVERVYARYELKELSQRSHAVILGLFPHPNCLEYQKFCTAAVKWLETDPEKSIRFAVAFAISAEDIMRHKNPKLPIILFINNNGMNLLHFTGKWNASQIVLRVKAEMKRSSHPINAYSTPSTIAVEIHSRPVLTIFANDLHMDENFYTIMKNAMGFSSSLHASHKSCVMGSSGNNANSESIMLKLDDMYQNHRDMPHSLCYKEQLLSMHNLKYYYFVNQYLNNLFSSFIDISEKEPEDHRSSHKLLEIYQYSKCLKNANCNTPETKIAIAKFVKKFADTQRLHHFERHNHTLSVVILDTAEHKDFLKVHGIQNSYSSAAAVFIVDPSEEGVFVMQEQFTFAALLHFVRNYYEKDLNTMAKSTRDFENVATTVNIHDINRQMFLNYINQDNVTTVVLLHSPECAFTGLMSHTLLQVKALLNSNEIRIVRLNVKANDLPWEFVMPSLPALIAFPRGRSMDSQVFPANLKLDVRNVMGFILAQMEPVDQVKVVLGSCQRMLLLERQRKCFLFAKKLVTGHITNHLKYWQVFEQDRHFILERLKQFKDVTLTIQRSFRV